MDTPVPISNTEVKHGSGDDIRKGKITSCQTFFIFYNNNTLYREENNMKLENKDLVLKQIKRAIVCIIIALSISLIITIISRVSLLAWGAVGEPQTEEEALAQAGAAFASIGLWLLLVPLSIGAIVPAIIGLVNYIKVFVTTFKVEDKKFLILMAVGFAVAPVGLVGLFMYKSAINKVEEVKEAEVVAEQKE